MTARKTTPASAGTTRKARTTRAAPAAAAPAAAAATAIARANAKPGKGMKGAKDAKGSRAARPARAAATARSADAAKAAPAVMQPTAQYRVGRGGATRHARSAAMAAIHSAASDLHAGGAIDLVTLRQFDRTCLSEQAIAPQEVRAIRRANHVSQTVFARCLGTSESTVKQWESGAKRPSGMARTLLNAVRKHGLAVLY